LTPPTGGTTPETMRSFLHWLVVTFVLGTSAAFAVRPTPRPLAVEVDDAVVLSFGAMVLPLAPTVVVPPSRSSWCEPLEPTSCRTQSDCSAARDGTLRVCTPEWWVEGSTRRVCVAAEPDEATQAWRSARLRVLVDELCNLDNGCDSRQLHAYLSVLIQRESSWQPHAVHRLRADRRANVKAWTKLSATYVGSPAHDEPSRWSAGLGYFGANPAYQLARWDATAEPETLCGEVEAVLVHLRAARDRWRRLDGGVNCEGVEHHGTDYDGRPSWYDISQANSGSNACPAEDGRALDVRRGFEQRSEKAELDPYGPVSLSMLGNDVAKGSQDAFAEAMRERMDRLHPGP
jgi:hypothetical protein